MHLVIVLIVMPHLSFTAVASPPSSRSVFVAPWPPRAARSRCERRHGRVFLRNDKIDNQTVVADYDAVDAVETYLHEVVGIGPGCRTNIAAQRRVLAFGRP